MPYSLFFAVRYISARRYERAIKVSDREYREDGRLENARCTLRKPTSLVVLNAEAKNKKQKKNNFLGASCRPGIAAGFMLK